VVNKIVCVWLVGDLFLFAHPNSNASSQRSTVHIDLMFRCLLESLFTNSSMLVGYSATASFQTGAGSFHAPNIFRLFLMLAGSKYYKSTVFFLRRWMLTRTSTVCQYPNSFSLLIGYIFWPLGQCLLILFSLVIPCHCFILRHLASIRRSLVQHLIYLVT